MGRHTPSSGDPGAICSSEQHLDLLPLLSFGSRRTLSIPRRRVGPSLPPGLSTTASVIESALTQIAFPQGAQKTGVREEAWAEGSHQPERQSPIPLGLLELHGDKSKACFPSRSTTLLRNPPEGSHPGEDLSSTSLQIMLVDGVLVCAPGPLLMLVPLKPTSPSTNHSASKVYRALGCVSYRAVHIVSSLCLFGDLKRQGCSGCRIRARERRSLVGVAKRKH